MIDKKKLKFSVEVMLEALGEDVNREGLKETPQRVTNMWEEIYNYPKPDLKFFASDQYDEIVLVRDIPFYSICEHHLLPFFGIGHIAYIPNSKVIGLSKLGRLLDFYARRLNIQERLTCQVAESIWKAIQPEAVMVILEAEHLCMSMRGVQKPGHITSTSKVLGKFRDDYRARNEALMLIGREKR